MKSGFSPSFSAPFSYRCQYLVALFLNSSFVSSEPLLSGEQLWPLGTQCIIQSYSDEWIRDGEAWNNSRIAQVVLVAARCHFAKYNNNNTYVLQRYQCWMAGVLQIIGEAPEHRFMSVDSWSPSHICTRYNSLHFSKWQFYPLRCLSPKFLGCPWFFFFFFSHPSSDPSGNHISSTLEKSAESKSQQHPCAGLHHL